MARRRLARGAHAAGSDIIKVGLIGCGGRGSGAAANAMNAGKDVHLVAMGDLLEERLKDSRPRLKKTYPEQVVVDDAHCFAGFDAYQKVLDSGIDVAVIAVTSHFHPVLLKAAVDAGKHVFCEKPCAIDMPGVRMALAASEDAKKKNLSLVSGLCWRYDLGVREMIKRVQDGQIGEIIAIQENYLRGPYVLRERKKEWSEMEYQIQNWYHFNWLSGDDPAQSLIHNFTVTSWAMGDVPPLKRLGDGRTPGVRRAELRRRVRPPGHRPPVRQRRAHLRLLPRHPRLLRQQLERRFSAPRAATFSPSKPYIEGEKPWRYKGPTPSMYDVEHKELFEAIRAGKPVNNGQYMCLCAELGILSPDGRLHRPAGHLGATPAGEVHLRPAALRLGRRAAGETGPQRPIPGRHARHHEAELSGDVDWKRININLFNAQVAELTAVIAGGELPGGIFLLNL